MLKALRFDFASFRSSRPAGATPFTPAMRWNYHPSSSKQGIVQRLEAIQDNFLEGI
ncbi:MAG: hypothetical protein LLG15_07010 [Betaproteobacteria bacterium]|nr:hypothetical protein [Betaproteobacteria bacterium]